MALSNDQFLQWGYQPPSPIKRKSIPPFVQKLNSFLEDGKNTDLIRWSDAGDSFIVLDEDEFARTLIPELFKHNNYASFVRQLNMYGFHKKVGLSDNSMRASERKNKTPSEYSNPYFKRGRPELLAMIQKPKTATSKKGKKAADTAEIEEDNDGEDIEELLAMGNERIRPRPQLALEQGDSSMSQEQFQSIQRELQTIKQQQSQIQRMMRSLKTDQDNLYGQAASFQDQHSRHENSINAILTFLATVYNRSLQGHEGMQGMQNLFPANEQHSGTVVDVGDYNFDDSIRTEVSPNRQFKKPPLLLTDGSQQDRASTMSPSHANTFPTRDMSRIGATPNTAPSRMSATPRPAVEEIFDSADSTPMPVQHDIMNVINNTNARNGASPGNTPDLSHMITSLENSGGANPLNPTQRADMLRLINQTSGNSGNGGDNALINATPPPGPSNFDRHLANSRANYDDLAKLQAEQDKNVQNLTNLLQPLSPSGSIPGIHDNATLPPAPWDVEDFLNSTPQDYFNDVPINVEETYSDWPPEFPTQKNFKPAFRHPRSSEWGTESLNNVYSKAMAEEAAAQEAQEAENGPHIVPFNDYDDMFPSVSDAPNTPNNGGIKPPLKRKSPNGRPVESLSSWTSDEDSVQRRGRKLSVSDDESSGRKKFKKG